MLLNNYNKKNKMLSKIIAVVFSFNTFIVPTTSFAAETNSTATTSNSTTTPTTSTETKNNANSTVTTTKNTTSSGTTTTTTTVTRTESQEEQDYEIIEKFASMGLNDTTKLEKIKAQIAQAEETEKNGGEKVGETTKSLKALIEKYDDVMSRMNSNGISASDLPTTKAQIAAIRTQYNKAITDANTRCKNSGGTDCALSDEGKTYARILSTIDNQQNNTTSSTSTTTNATSQNTSTTTTCPTSYTLDKNAGKCCPSAQPNYNTSDGKCYATLPSSSSDDSSNNGLDMLKALGMLGLTNMASKSIANNNNNNKDNKKLATATYNLEKGVNSKYVFSENPIPLTGNDVFFTINNISKNNSKQHVRIIIPMFFSSDINKTNITSVPAYVIETKEGEKTLIFPGNEDLSKSMFKKDKKSGLVLRRAGVYKLIVQYYTIDKKTGNQTITLSMPIKFRIADTMNVISSDNDVSDTGVAVSQGIDEIKQQNLSASGTVQTAEWDSTKKLCHIDLKGNVVDNETDTGTNDSNFSVYSSKIDKNNCTKDKIGGANIVYDKLDVENGENGDTFIGDADSKLNIDKNLVFANQDVTEKIAQEHKLLTNIYNSQTGATYPVTVSADGKHYYHITTGEEYSLDELSKTVGIDMNKTTIKTDNGITSVINNDTNESVTATQFDNTTYAGQLYSNNLFKSLNKEDTSSVSTMIENKLKDESNILNKNANAMVNMVYDAPNIYSTKGNVSTNKNGLNGLNGVDVAKRNLFSLSNIQTEVNNVLGAGISIGKEIGKKIGDIGAGILSNPNDKQLNSEDNKTDYSKMLKKVEISKENNQNKIEAIK